MTSSVNQIYGKIPQKDLARVLSLAVSLVLILSASYSHALTEIEAKLPEVAALLHEISPPGCFSVTLAKANSLAKAETVQFKVQATDSQVTKGGHDTLELVPRKSSGLEPILIGTRALFSPKRALIAVEILSNKMSELEPLCAHSIEKKAADIERRLVELIDRLEQSTEDLAKRQQTLIAFDIETIGVVEGLQLPLAGTMAQEPKALPSPAQFGRELGIFRRSNVAAIIHARGGDLAQPRAASRELSVPLVVLDLDKEIPKSVPYTKYLEEFYRAVLSGLGVSLLMGDEREQ